MHSYAVESIESKMATMQNKIFCIHEFIKTESATAVQCAFHLRFNIQPRMRKRICCWNHQFEQINCLCKGKSSSQPRVSEENVRRIQESFERSSCKSIHRASRELGILQPTVWRVLRRRLLFSWVHLFESPCIVLIIGIIFSVVSDKRRLSLFTTSWWLCTFDSKCHRTETTFTHIICGKINKIQLCFLCCRVCRGEDNLSFNLKITVAT